MRRPVLLALLVVLALPARAAAHASLTGGAPEPGGVATTAPRTLSLRFDEAVDPALAVVRVEDARGRRYDAGPVRATPGRGLRVALRRGLPDGQYVVLYRVVSDDGHTIPGGYGFAVGRDAVPPPARLGGGGPEIRAAAGLGTAEAIARGVRDGGLAVVAGALAFLALVWLRALPEAAGGGEDWRAAGAAFARALRRLVAAAAAAGALGAVAGIVLTASATTLDATTVRAVLDTRFGTSTAAGAALLLAIALLAAVGLRPRRARERGVLRTAQLGATGLAVAPVATTRRVTVAAGAVALALAAVPVLAGHATTRAHPVLLTATGVVHVLAASAWTGGIAALLVAVAAATRRLEPVDRTVLLRAVLRRFSRVALAAVVAIAATGAVQALVEVGSPDALIHTGFGRAVLIKVGLLVALAGVAAAHRTEHLPRLDARLRRHDSPGPAGAAIRSTLRVEALGLLAVLAVTGALAGSAPPAGAPPGPAALAVAFEQATLRGSLAPARAGSNTLSFTLARRGGDVAFDDLERVLVTARGPHGATVRAAVPGRRDGSYRVPLRLPAAGTWRLALTLRVDAFNAFTRDVRVRVH